MSPRDDHSPLEALRTAAERGDVDAMGAQLARLGAQELQPVFSLSFSVRAHPVVEFVLLQWVANLPVPYPESSRHGSWLRALNNGARLAITCAQVGTPRRLAMAELALRHASDNLAIFHNAACVFCALDEPARAMAAVRGAVDHGYERVGVFADDEDLALISGDPEFRALVGPIRDAAQEALSKRVTSVSMSLLRGAQVPAELVAIVRGQLEGLGLPPGVARLADELDDDDDPVAVRDPALDAFVRDHVDWIARSHSEGVGPVRARPRLFTFGAGG